MIKKELLQCIVETLSENLNAAQRAVDSAHETATHKETVAKNKYDTFGLEASYLAHGQAKRVAEIEQALLYYRTVKPVLYNDDQPIGSFALVSLETLDGQYERTVVIANEGGGVVVNIKELEVTVVTPQSPLGSALLGKEIADIVVINIADEEVSYEVISIQ